MDTRYIPEKPTFAFVLPNGRTCRVSTYVKAWQAIKQEDPEHLVTGFFDWPMSGGEVLSEMRRGLHDRINRHLPWYRQGRKWEPDWQRLMAFTSGQVNTPRLAIHWLPPDLQGRLGHRLSDRP